MSNNEHPGIDTALEATETVTPIPHSKNEEVRREERVLTAEERAEIFRVAIEEGVEAARQMVAERFEQAPDKYDRLAFHNKRHTNDVIRRFDTIIETIKTSAPELYDKHAHEIGRLSAAHHDTVQKWEPNASVDEEGLVKIMRKRSIGQNEAESTAGALLHMDKINEEAGTEIFTESDKMIIRGGHEATVPGFNPEKGTVIQPHLTEQSSIITRAIALADLGTAGMDGPEAYLPEGDALFREENIDIADAMEHPEILTDAQKSFFRKRMLGWSAFQSTFAAGRKAMLEEEIRPLPTQVQEELKTLFSKFNDSISAAEAQAARRATLSFETLAAEMGYTWSTETKEE